MNISTLDNLNLNSIGYIYSLNTSENIKRRLLDMGVVKGTTIQKVLVSSGDNMVGYFIKGAVVAIRKDDTKDIEAEMIK